MNKLYNNVNPNKLVDEIQAQGLLEIEQMAFFPKDNGLEIRFTNIREIQTDTIISYSKRVTNEITVDEKLGTTKTIETWEDFDPTMLLASIQAVVNAHDSTPYPEPNPNLTNEERINRLELVLLQTEGVI